MQITPVTFGSIAPVAGLLLVGLGFVVFFCLGFCKRFTGLGGKHAAIIWIGSLIVAGALTAYRIEQMENVLRMAHGLGWIALMLAVAAAVLPLVAPTMARQTQRTLIFVTLGTGAFAVIYLLAQDMRHAGIGMILALAGYALEFAGTIRERQA